MAHHHKLDCLVKRLDYSVVVTGKVQNSSECYPDDISSTAEPFVTKPGVVMHHHGSECHARRLVCCLQGQGDGRGGGCHASQQTFLVKVCTLLIMVVMTAVNKSAAAGQLLFVKIRELLIVMVMTAVDWSPAATHCL